MSNEQESTFARESRSVLVGVAVLIGALLWAYWATLSELFSRWWADPQYSHGFVIPVFSLVTLYLRRAMVAGGTLAPSWWGLPVLLAGIGLRLFDSYYYVEYLDAFSLLPTLVGATILVGGWKGLRFAWPAILLLFFMIPLPYSVDVLLRGPLRTIATRGSTFAIQTLGLPAVAEGNVILVRDVPINVAEACSGLSMLMVFFALSTTVAILIQAPLWERLLIVASALPIALIANIMRITVTGILYQFLDTELVNTIFHDYLGLGMMIVAMLLLWGEVWLLSRLFVAEEDRPMVAGLGVAGAARGR